MEAAQSQNCNTFIALGLVSNGFETILLDPSYEGMVFVPTDTAFQKLNEFDSMLLSDLVQDVDLVTSIMNFHATMSKELSEELAEGRVLINLEREPLSTGVFENGTVSVTSGESSANIITPDIEAANSIVHIIDNVLLPAPIAPLKQGSLPTEVAQQEIPTEVVSEATQVVSAGNTSIFAALEDNDVSLLVNALYAADITEEFFLRLNKSELTLFIPTDQALMDGQGFPAGLSIDNLTTQEYEGLQQIMLNHIVPAVVYSSNLSDGQILPTLAAGNELVVKLDEGVKIVSSRSEASVVVPDIAIGDSVIHIVDSVLLPSLNEDKVAEYKADNIPEEVIVIEPVYDNIFDAIQSIEDLNVLFLAILASDIDPNTLQLLSSPDAELTLFAPSNQALNALEEISFSVSQDNYTLYTLMLEDTLTFTKIIQNHIVPSAVNSSSLFNGQIFQTLAEEELEVNITDVVQIIASASEATVTKTDIQAGSSVIHIVDMVLLPEISQELTGFATYKAESVPSESVVKQPSYDSIFDALSNDNEFLVLSTLIFGAGLDKSQIDLLKSSDAEITLFAPTGEALRNLQDVSNNLSLYNLLFQDPATLKNIILNHVVPEAVNLSSLSYGSVLPTLSGDQLVVNLTDGVDIIASLSMANVVQADIQAGSSIIHIVDMALLPKSEDDSLKYKAEDLLEESNTKQPTYYSVLDAVSSIDELSFLETLIFGAGFDASYFEALNNSDGQVTLFAPTNKAILNLQKISPDITLYNLLFQDTTKLMKIILNHVVPEVVNSSSLVDGQVLPTFIQNELAINLTDGVQIVAPMSSAKVVEADIQAGSSIVHIVDMALLPALENDESEFKSEDLQVEYIAKEVNVDMYDSILEALRDMDDMSMLLTAIFTVFLDDSEYYEIINGSDASITLFAPTNQAFISMSNDEYKLNDMFFTDTIVLSEILLNHMVPNTFFSQDFYDGQSLFTLANDELVVETVGPISIISNTSEATIQFTDIMAGNSVIHVVDVVLVPDMSKDETITSPFEYKAAQLPADQFENIDFEAFAVSARPPAQEELGQEEEEEKYGSILEALEGSEVEMLISTIFSAGFAPDSVFLQSILGSDQYVTFFAPSDEALINLESSSLYELIYFNPERLQKLLLNHLVPEVIPSSNLQDGQSLYTLADGDELLLDVDGRVRIFTNASDADVIKADIYAGQAIVHIINDVLVPIFPEESPEEAADGLGVAQYYGYESYNAYTYDDDYNSYYGIDTVYEYLLQVTHAQDLTILAAALLSSDKYSYVLLDRQFLYTLFAPTDQAFDDMLYFLGIDVDSMLNDKELLDEILSQHIVPSKELIANLQDEVELETLLNNGSLSVDSTDNGIVVTAQATSASVLVPDLEVALGVVHVIDTVLLPLSRQSQTPALVAPEPEDMMSKLGSIPDLSSFLEAVILANLTAELVDAEPITIFAPNDDAFQFALTTLQIPIEELGYSTFGLEDVLLYHVVPGMLYSQNLTNVTLNTLLEESTIDVSIGDDGVLVDGFGSEAYVTEADVTVGNTVIHIIDAILIPYDKQEEEAKLAERVQEAQQDGLSVSAEDTSLVQMINLIGGFFNN